MQQAVSGFLWLLGIGFLAAAAIAAVYKAAGMGADTSYDRMQHVEELLRQQAYTQALAEYRRLRRRWSGLEPDAVRAAMFNMGYCYEMLAREASEHPTRCIKLLQKALNEYQEGIAHCSPEDEPTDYAHGCFQFAHALMLVYTVEQQTLEEMVQRTGQYVREPQTAGPAPTLQRQVGKHLEETLYWLTEAETICRKFNNHQRLAEVLQHKALCHRDAWTWGMAEKGVDAAIDVWEQVRTITRPDDPDGFALASLELANDRCRQHDMIWKQNDLRWSVMFDVLGSQMMPSSQTPADAIAAMTHALGCLEEGMEVLQARQADIYDAQGKMSQVSQQLGHVHMRLANFVSRADHLQSAAGHYQGAIAASQSAQLALAYDKHPQEESGAFSMEAHMDAARHLEIGLLRTRWCLAEATQMAGFYQGNMEQMQAAAAQYIDIMKETAAYPQLIEDGRWLVRASQALVSVMRLLGQGSQDASQQIMQYSAQYGQMLAQYATAVENHDACDAALWMCRALHMSLRKELPHYGEIMTAEAQVSLQHCHETAWRSAVAGEQAWFMYCSLESAWYLWRADEAHSQQFQQVCDAMHLAEDDAVVALFRLALWEHTGRESVVLPLSALDLAARRAQQPEVQWLWVRYLLALWPRTPKAADIKRMEPHMADISLQTGYVALCMAIAAAQQTPTPTALHVVMDLCAANADSLSLFARMDGLHRASCLLFTWAEADMQVSQTGIPHDELLRQAHRLCSALLVLMDAHPLYVRADWLDNRTLPGETQTNA